MMSCPDFIPRTHCTPSHVSRRCKPLRIGDGIAAMPWVYEGLYVIESCLMSPDPLDWSSIF